MVEAKEYSQFYESGNVPGGYAADSVVRNGGSNDLGSLEMVEVVEESVEVASPRGKEEVRGHVRKFEVKKLNEGHGKVDYAFRSASKPADNRKDPATSNFDANLINILSQGHSRSRKRPRSEDPFKLNELLGLNVDQGEQQNRGPSGNNEKPASFGIANFDLNVRVSPVNSAIGSVNQIGRGRMEKVAGERVSHSPQVDNMEVEIQDPLEIGR
ncbi:hypothetical protein L1987_70967 [Smallanthus sonchifolius]|uniref:Uncharacterized protein n=1 Tax=Smallanthus sonchifolius TaxID=185202 RepID=A0ACB9ARS4_9ASTR|nr:hypothetical protein L1987_70967 [Smallanthus sonchifolius]